MSDEKSEKTEPRFPFVLVDVTAEEADVTSYLLFELGAQGVEERDETTLVKNAKPGKITLSASFVDDESAKEAVANLDPALDPRIEEIIGDAWRDAWKDHYKPFTLCEGLVVRPPWEAYEAKGDEKVLELEPGRAFGTGLHETTSLVAKALAARKKEVWGARVLDVGCGSGVLSLVALAFGAAQATSVDVDPDAVAVTLENAQRNAFANRIDASTTDVTKITDTFPVVVANIEANVLIPMAPALISRVKNSGFLVLSGILAPQSKDVVKAYDAFTLEEELAKGEWVALVFRAKPHAP